MSEENQPENKLHPEIEYVVRETEPKKRGPLRRLGCAVLVILWMVILMIPFFLFALAIEGEIRLGHRGDVPDKHEHPLLQIGLVQELDFRGLSITNSSVNRASETDLCVQTNVRYLLWEGEGDPAAFCDCYTRPDADADWQFTESVMEACPS